MFDVCEDGGRSLQWIQSFYLILIIRACNEKLTQAQKLISWVALNRCTRCLTFAVKLMERRTRHRQVALQS